MKLRMHACVAALLILTACGSEQQAEKPAPKPPPTAQEVLDTATKHLKDSGTGSYTIQNTGLNTLVEGEFDLDEPYVSQSMTMPTPDEPNGYTVYTYAYEDEAFVGFSEGELKKCYLRYEDSDFSEAFDLAEGSGVNISDLKSTVPPVVEMVMDPKARGFAEGNPDNVKADVNLVAAFTASLPKAAFTFADSLDEKATIPVTLQMDGDRYAGATYSLGTIFREANIDAGDVRRTGLVDKGVTPKQALNMLSSVQVTVTYESFGRTVELARPKKSRIIEVDFENIDAGATCRAAGR